MATVKQLALRIKYAKTSLNSLTKKLGAGKTKLKALEADLKKAKVVAGKKKPVKKAAPKKRAKKR
jgi:hypothetical protein